MVRTMCKKPSSGRIKHEMNQKYHEWAVQGESALSYYFCLKCLFPSEWSLPYCFPNEESTNSSRRSECLMYQKGCSMSGMGMGETSGESARAHTGTLSLLFQLAIK